VLRITDIGIVNARESETHRLPGLTAGRLSESSEGWILGFVGICRGQSLRSAGLLRGKVVEKLWESADKSI